MERNIGMERNGEYVGAIIVNIILLYIFNNLLNWHVYFVTSAFNEVLWIINLSIAVAIIGNFLMLLYRPEWFRHVTKIVLNIVAFAAVYLVYTVFPLISLSHLIGALVTDCLIKLQVEIYLIENHMEYH